MEADQGVQATDQQAMFLQRWKNIMRNSYIGAPGRLVDGATGLKIPDHILQGRYPAQGGDQ